VSKRHRVTVTALHEPDTHYFETGNRQGKFWPVAMPDLGYGCEGYKGTEATFYQSVAWLVERAKEEGSRVFILGFGPASIPSTWIKTAEMIIQGSDVRVALIPLCKMVGNRDSHNPKVHGTIIHVDKTGITKVDVIGETLLDSFFGLLSMVAESADAWNA
jgi:hypothetical protein